MEEKDEQIKKMCFCRRVWAKYDHGFLIAYAAQYANQGLKFLLNIALQDLLKNYYMLEPTQSQLLTTIIFLPMSIKFIFGIISDTVPICGSRKKSWLIIWNVISAISSLICAAVYIESATAFVALVLLFSIGSVFNDVVVDSLMVIQAKRDPKMGA